MPRYIIPPDIHALIVERFVTRRKPEDSAAEHAMKQFIARMKSTPQTINEELARSILRTQKDTNDFIKTVWELKKREDAEIAKSIAQQKATKRNKLYKKFEKAFKKVGITDVENLSSEAEKASPLIRFIVASIINMGSLRTLVVTGVVIAFAVSVAAGITNSAMFDGRALKKHGDGIKKFLNQWVLHPFKKDNQPVPGKPAPPPHAPVVTPKPTYPTQGAPVKVEIIPFCGMADPISKKTMTELLKDGQSVTIHTAKGELCLSPP